MGNGTLRDRCRYIKLVHCFAVFSGLCLPMPEGSPDAIGHKATTDAGPVQSLTLSSILSTASLVAIFFVVSRVTGILRDIVILAEFNLSAELDAYQAAFRIPDMIFEVVAGGALGSAYLPAFTRVLHRAGSRSAWHLFSQVLNAVTLILLLLSVVSILTAPWLVRTLIAPGFTPEQQQLVAHLMRWLLLGTLVYGASGLCMASLNTYQHFAFPALAPGVRNLAIMAGALMLVPYWGIYGLVAGAIAGSVLHLAVQIPILMRRRYQFRYRLVLDWSHKDLRHVVTLLLPRMLGLIFVHLNFIVNTNLVSQLAPGSVSALEYGFRLMLLPVGLFAQALAIVVFPSFAVQVEQQAYREMEQTFRRMIRLILFLAMPSAVGLFLLRVPLIEVLYHRGSFTSESTMSVAYALQFFLLGLTSHAVVEVAVRAFYALHDTRTPVIIGILTVLLNIGLSIWWVRFLDFGGPALANSVATTVEMLLLLWWLRRRLLSLRWSHLFRETEYAFVSTLGMGSALWFTLDWLEDTTRIPGVGVTPYLELGIGILVAVTTYGILNRLFNNWNWLFQSR